MLTSLLGLFLLVNSRLSGVLFFLVSKYRLRHLTASSPMKVGDFSFSTFTLHGVGVSGSRIFSTFFILSCFRASGVSPDCLMIVKNACSRGGHFSVISLISAFAISLVFVFLTSREMVTFHYY